MGGNELGDSVFVKKFVNNLAFQFELKQPCTHIFKLNETSFFHACLSYPKSTDCQWFKILSRPFMNCQFCEKCGQDSKNQQRCGKRKQTDAGKRDTSASHIPNSTLSPGGLIKKTNEN